MLQETETPKNFFYFIKKNAVIAVIKIVNFNFAMIYIIREILVLIKNHLIYLKDNVFEFFFDKYNRLLLF